MTYLQIKSSKLSYLFLYQYLPINFLEKQCFVDIQCLFAYGLQVVLVPTLCSWLNLVERFFALTTTKRIRRGSFSIVREREEEISDFLCIHNSNPRSFKWTASAEVIFEKVARCREMSGTLNSRTVSFPLKYYNEPSDFTYVFDRQRLCRTVPVRNTSYLCPVRLNSFRR